jgi:hypothetical protein
MTVEPAWPADVKSPPEEMVPTDVTELEKMSGCPVITDP